MAKTKRFDNPSLNIHKDHEHKRKRQQNDRRLREFMFTFDSEEEFEDYLSEEYDELDEFEPIKNTRR